MYEDALDVVAALANEFSDLPARSVVRSVTQAAEELPAGSTDLITQVARMKLLELQKAGPGA